MEDATFFASQADFHAWLQERAASATALLVGFRKKASGNGGIAYAQALDEALCYGWIDGVRRRLDDASFTIRFTPRRPRSIWSAVNIARVKDLIARGLMQPAGLATYAKRDDARSRIYAYEQRPTDLDDASLQRFQANAQAWAFWEKQPPSYRRTAAYWVLSTKKEETRQSRLATLIADSEASRRIGPLTPTAKPRDSSAP